MAKRSKAKKRARPRRAASRKKTPARKAVVPKRRPAAAKRRRQPQPRPAGGAAAEARQGAPVLPAGVQSEFAATAAGCLDQEVATALVFSCTGVGAVQPATPLGTLFPSDVQRRGFCGCVFNKARMAGANVGPSDIPCSGANSIADVIDRISC